MNSQAEQNWEARQEFIRQWEKQVKENAIDAGMKCEKFKAGDKVTIKQVGFGYIRRATNMGYEVYIVNKQTAGLGYWDWNLLAGWGKRV